MTLQITTEKAEAGDEGLCGQYRHGISVWKAVGGYSGRRCTVLHTVVSAYEAADIVALMREADPHVIVNQFKPPVLRKILSGADGVAGLHGIGADNFAGRIWQKGLTKTAIALIIVTERGSFFCTQAAGQEVLKAARARACRKGCTIIKQQGGRGMPAASLCFSYAYRKNGRI